MEYDNNEEYIDQMDLYEENVTENETENESEDGELESTSWGIGIFPPGGCGPYGCPGLGWGVYRPGCGPWGCNNWGGGWNRPCFGPGCNNWGGGWNRPCYGPGCRNRRW